MSGHKLNTASRRAAILAVALALPYLTACSTSGPSDDIGATPPNQKSSDVAQTPPPTNTVVVEAPPEAPPAVPAPQASPSEPVATAPPPAPAEAVITPAPTPDQTTTPPAPSAAAAQGNQSVSQSPQAAAAVAPDRPLGQPQGDQELFDTDLSAAQALAAAAQGDDRQAMRQIFGPAGKELATGDRVEDRNDRQEFARRAAEQLRLVKKDDRTSWIYVGKEDWPFPIPLVRLPNGKWFFDTEAGKQEILARQIGADELETINVCREYVQAQREYASQERDNSGVLQYAQHLMSTPGQHDGLYWESQPGEPESPLGPLVAQARMEGYAQNTASPANPDAGASAAAQGTSHHPFHGYYFHVLTAQGPAAPGGAYNYIINGHMIAGFALVAWPDRYGASGVMTFIISHQGKLYQKDLGQDTNQIVRHMKDYNPDETWTLVKD